MMTYVLSSTTSKGAYDALANVFNVQGALAKVLARRKFLRYEIEEGANMEEEVRTIRQLKEELTLLGTVIPDDEFSLTLLTALPPSWDPFISSIGAVPGSTDLIGRVIQEDGRRKDRSSTTTSLYVQGGNKKKSYPNKSKFKKGVFCHHCGKEGHLKPDCRSLKREESSAHKSSQKTSNAAHVVEDGAAVEDEVAFVVEDEATMALLVKGDVWLGDNCTQSHIVRDRSLFVDYSDTPGASVTGAGTCPALGRGTVKINFKTKNGLTPITLKDTIYAPEMPYNLISLGRLTSAGLSYTGSGDYLRIVDRD